MAIPVDENNTSGWVGLLGAAGSGALRLSLLFGSAAVALAVILTPIVESEATRLASNRSGVDLIATGSTVAASKRVLTAKNVYTIRRSVLQSDRNDICIIGADGVRTGTC